MSFDNWFKPIDKRLLSVTQVQTHLRDASFALEGLRELLSSADWSAAGGKLPTERDLAQRLEVGRHSVRRALDVLEAEGVIWRRQGAGTFVGQRAKGAVEAEIAKAIPRASFDEVLEVRLRIEPQLAQLAAIRATPEEITRMKELTSRFLEAEDIEACELWDGAFHRQIAVAARNELFLALFDVMNRVRRDKIWQTTRGISLESGEAKRNTFEDHSKIIVALEERRPLEAAHAMRDHVLNTQVRLLRRLTTFEGL